MACCFARAMGGDGGADARSSDGKKAEGRTRASTVPSTVRRDTGVYALARPV